ncbi:MAG: ATP-binding protein [Acidobacteriia bacterium]|nr:ATP-binding protein [Terriglobia bacterium]MYG04599.1 ATP-binding protein [Terriglobia bacterium]MYK08796.1 ATP-binding protein [Terriglobia bacterium]
MTPPAVSPQQLEAMLKRLHLACARRSYPELVEQAERGAWSFRDFLAALASAEIEHRRQTRLRRCVRQARFPVLHTLEEFDFSVQPELRPLLLGSAFAPEFAAQGGCLVLKGRSGRGKTHLATAIAYQAILHGHDALFAIANDLVETLSLAARNGRLRDALAAYVRPQLLVVDEVGYLTHGPDAANVLFHVVDERHRRRRSMVFTTNKPLERWGRVLHDPDLAEAILDRILERGRIVTLEGPSMRTRHIDSVPGRSNQEIAS